MQQHTRRTLVVLTTLLCTIAGGPLMALVVPEPSPVLGPMEYRHPDLTIQDDFRQPGELPPQAAAEALARLETLGVAAGSAYLDARGGRFASLLPSDPLLPGAGSGNALAWGDLGLTPPQSPRAFADAARDLVRGYVQQRRQALRIDPAELGAGQATAYGDGELVQVYLPRAVGGVPVRDSYVNAVVNRGNLVLMGAHRWGDVHVSTRPQVTLDAALDKARAYLAPAEPNGSWGKNELMIVPLARPQAGPSDIGLGYVHRLAWVLRPAFVGEHGRWEVLVDAHSGEILSFEDTNSYVATARRVQGGVLPVSNDGVAPDGVEQAGWPMPFDNVATPGGTVTTDAGGNLPAPVDGNITSTLSGQFIRMNDNCGAISLTSAGDIDFGTSGGTDCVTPGFGGPGNTHASRTGFHELNRIKEMARGQLPGNGWLQNQLTSNMNINSTCNAFWNGATVNFYRSGGGCSNTGELAGVFDHEWGHGMDANDATPGVSNPGEGIADVYAALRYNSSCIGRNFRPGVQCGGYGDPCTNCTGIRDIDFANRQSGQPHDFTWANATCGGGVHCRGYVYSEAVWDLWHRDLPPLFGMDDNTAHEVVTRLTYIGAGGVGTWYSGTPPFGGCSATGGYLQFLAADDDNGNINDGTPHMSAIFAAFDRHEIACNTPAVVDSGCAGTPTTAPTLSGSPVDKSASLSWTAVAGASKYEVFRTDGVFACDFGKTKIGETVSTSFNDSGLQNGRDYSYIVVPIGAHDACLGPASNCATVRPAAGPNLDVDAGSAVLTILTGDGDEFLDNCEDGRMTFDVVNTGLGSLTNVRIVNVTAVSHPSTTIITTFPAPVSPSTLAQGASGTGSFDFTAGGLSFDDTLVFQVDVTADELSITKSQNLSVGSTESDFVTYASRTFSFEVGNEGWTVAQGTFNRSSALGGGNGTTWAEASSSGLHNQCDRIRSPLMRLQAASTLTLWNNFDIEPLSAGTWYDRANVGVIDSGVRTAVSPDGGRLYNADSSGPGNYSGCNDPEPGWAGLAATWASSSWSSTALQSGTFAGSQIQLEVIYATDPALANRGFSFDEVTITNVDFQEADGQSDVCPAGCTSDAQCADGLFCNGVETCDLGTGTCQPGTPVDCNDLVSCTVDSCNEATDACDNVPSDAFCDDGLFCNGAETCDPVLDCQPGSDPCPGGTCDEAGDFCIGCGDGTCGPGEDCISCPADCPSLPIPGSVCGNGLCEAGDGETCLSCPTDCAGDTGGKPSNRFCCGFGDGFGPDGCGDSRCVSGGFSCTELPTGGGGTSCCGDGLCEGDEDVVNCAIDCDTCGNGVCDPGEDQCSCAADCGLPSLNEIGLCTDQVDNDCDGPIDCADSDCFTDPACVCTPKGGACTLNSECCSGVCKSNGTCR